MELWDVYDKKGRKTGALKEKEADYLPGEYHLAVEAWVFNRRREILIQQRSWHRENPAGKVEPDHWKNNRRGGFRTGMRPGAERRTGNTGKTERALLSAPDRPGGPTDLGYLLYLAGCTCRGA